MKNNTQKIGAQADKKPRLYFFNRISFKKCAFRLVAQQLLAIELQ
ncbi:MAG: hypothetical protein IMF06_03190 [Proteobacteria bacterium]|nr:hypothetical protein [Pseudomonadota bacterium]